MDDRNTLAGVVVPERSVVQVPVVVLMVRLASPHEVQELAVDALAL